MQTKKIFDEVKSCSSPIRFAILKALQRQPMGYAYLMDFIGFHDTRQKSSRFAYHLRKLVKNHLIAAKASDKAYQITQRGRMAIHVLEELSERYLVEDANEICPNDTSLKHEFIQVCRKCSLIAQPMEVLR